MAAAGMRRELSQRARFEKATSAGSGSVAGKRGRWVAIVALETCGRATAVRELRVLRGLGRRISLELSSRAGLRQ